MIPRYTRPEMGAIWTEEAKFASWLEVEAAALDAWAEEGSVPAEAAEALRRRGAFTVDRIEEIEAEVDHDVIAFVTCVAENVGMPEGRWVHYGLTSSDVVDTALALRLVRATDLLVEDFDRLVALCVAAAFRWRDTPMAGRTHGMHAEPTTFGHTCAVWAHAADRARSRLRRAREMIRVGKLSGAVGTYSQIPPGVEAAVCTRLGLEVEAASTQVVARARHAELLAQLALAATACEQIALELRHLQRSEVGEVAEPFGTRQKGSSAMPHKRNPITAERICGLARLMRGWAAAGLEDVALWHQRDISHSSVERVVLPDATICLDYMAERTARLVAGMEVRPDVMLENMERTYGAMFAQNVLLGLVATGLDRDPAYRIVQTAARQAFEERRHLREVLKETPAVTDALTPAEIDALFDTDRMLGRLDPVFARLEDLRTPG
ncbi:MAG: adenylosuccinate lyase [Acidimicrobiia bacterium]|nr:adenylosuccinate lyase [Acidimicrobiia bacterium]